MTRAQTLTGAQLAAYFALMEVSSLLQHEVEQQLRRDGKISWVQFQILAGLSFDPVGRQRMTDIADRVVYSRSGFTYQATQLEQNGYVERMPDPLDERGTLVAITDKGRALVGALMPGHEGVVRAMLLEHLSAKDIERLTGVLTRVRDRMRARPPRSAVPRHKSRPAGG